MKGSVPLSPEEVRTLLAADPGALIIGGQALALWSLLYKVVLPEELESAVTDDLDFYGDRKLAMAFAQALPDARAIFPSPDVDHGTPNSAIVLIDDFCGQLGRTIQVDFLSVIHGLDEARAAKRSVEIRVEGVPAPKRVLHPMDCLISRIANLELPSKQNARGLAQARLAIRVAHTYLAQLLQTRSERDALKFAEIIFQLAARPVALDAKDQFDIDVLEAVPAAAFTSADFKEKRWPQMKAWIAAKIARRRRRRSPKLG